MNNGKKQKRLIPYDWELKKISEVATTGSGGTPLSTRLDFYLGGNIPWINSGEVGQSSIKSTKNFITKLGMENSSAKLFPRGSVLLAMYGATAGRASLLEIEATTNQAICAIIPKKGYNSKFIKYYLDLLYSYLVGVSTGSARDNLNQKGILDLEIPFPQENIQINIAKVLSDLDAKIELNNKINDELEAMAKTLYDYWFVQFDFPNEEGKPYKSSGGKMVWNEVLKMEIPEGWEVDTLSSFVNNDKSGDWGKEQEEGNYNQRVYCVRGADINGLNGKGELKTPERYILEKNLFKTLEPYDLIVEISGGSPVQSTGRLAYITEETLHRFDAPIICSNFCKAVTLKSKYYFYNFVFQWNSIYDAGVLFGYEGKTSGIKNLLFESFVSSHYTTIPPIELAKKFYDFMKPIQIKKEKNLKENQELASLRDWLLPMLMNGQVSVASTNSTEESYKVEDTILGMVAEPGIRNLSLQEKKLRRKMLATFIVNQSLSDTRFGKTKFEKLLHLIEYHIVKDDFNQKYSVQTAGPYDGGFTKLYWDEVLKAKWFKIEELGNLKRIVPGENHSKSLVEYNYFSAELKESISQFISLFKSKNYEKAEIVSTLFAVWNNRIINNEMITDALLKKDFLEWDKQKVKYADHLDTALAWMKKENIIPDGWGKYINRAKGK